MDHICVVIVVVDGLFKFGICFEGVVSCWTAEVLVLHVYCVLRASPVDVWAQQDGPMVLIEIVFLS